MSNITVLDVLNATVNITLNVTRNPLVKTPHKQTEGGILNGVVILSADISLFIIELLMINVLSRALAFPLKYLKQPRVIAEVIAGILLGPTAFGRIPGFTDTFFPASRLGILGIVANIGLILFLFMVGLELDMTLLISNWKRSTIISVTGMAVPFGFGAAVSVFLYNYFLIFMTEAPPLSSVVLFVAVAMSITAFPVLARILTETKLISTSLGIAAISAAAVDDAAAWCFLALVIAIVGSTSPITVLYIFLMLISFIAIMLGGSFLLQKKFSVPEKANQKLVVTCLLICFAAAWVTDLIGVHAIFGAFITGLCIPRQNHLTVQLIEKIEDLVTFIFLPLYFAYSGLRTNLGLLNTGIAWGAIILVISCAVCGKVGGVATVCKFLKMSWRESFTIGFLMNCKGLVELIVLNIGLDAGIINSTVFTIMVVMALVTTFMTSPIVNFLYPDKKRREVIKLERSTSSAEIGRKVHEMKNTGTLRALVCISGEDTVPRIVPLLELFALKNAKVTPYLHLATLLEITERESSVWSATLQSVQEAPKPIEPISSIEGIDCQHDRIIGTITEFPREIIEIIHENDLNLLIYPFLKGSYDNHHSTLEILQSILAIMQSSPATTTLYVPSSVSTVQGSGHGKLFVPFFGGNNDHEAVRLAISLSHRTPVVINRFIPSSDAAEPDSPEELKKPTGSLKVHPTRMVASLPVLEDDELLRQVDGLIKKETPNITFQETVYRPKEIIKVLDEEMAKNYSLVVLGRNIMENLSHEGHDTTAIQWDLVFGSVGSYLINNPNCPSNILIVNKSKRSPNFVSEIILSSSEGSVID